MELDLFGIEPQRLGGDLGERGPGALPHVCPRRLDQRRAVGPQRGPAGGRELRAGEDSRAHAPADEEAVLVAHLARRQRAG